MFKRSIFCDWKGHSWIMDDCRPDKNTSGWYSQILIQPISILSQGFHCLPTLLWREINYDLSIFSEKYAYYYWVINTPPFFYYFWQHQLAGADRKELIYTVAQHAYSFLPLPDCDEMLATCSPTCLINLCLKISGTCCQQE